MTNYRKILMAVLANFSYCEGTDHTNYPRLSPLEGLTLEEQRALLEVQDELETQQKASSGALNRVSR